MSWLQSEILKHSVIVFSKTLCPFCSQAKYLLTNLSVQYQTYELDRMKQGKQIQNQLFLLTNQRTVPNIFIGAEHIGGYSQLSSCLTSGSIYKLLEKHGIPYSKV